MSKRTPERACPQRGRRLAPWLACLMLMATAAYGGAPLSVSGAWIRLLPGDLPLAGYFALHNQTDRPETLVSATSPMFKRIELHHSMSVHGMDRMTSVKQVKVAPHAAVRFAPGGYHLMMWRKDGLEPGEMVPVTLKFADGTEVSASFTVKEPGE